ncbi:hypothetical protein F5Y10DRAFT_259927 [Nemania abortiva]|nr:hypothetical protein F5Y10DRAFT_259927 [Nemania abortiva]
MSDNTDQQPSSGDQSFLWPSAAHAGGDIADWVSSSQASAAPSTLVGSTAASAYPPAAANPIDGSTAAFPNANHAQVGVAQQIENTWVWQQIENDWQAWRANGGLPAVALHSSGPTTAAAAPLNPNLNARQFEGPAAAALNLSSFTDAAFVPQGVAGTIIDQSDSFAALVDHSVASQDASLHTQPVPPSANIQPLNLPSASQDAIQGTQLGSSSALFGALAVSQGSLNAFFLDLLFKKGFSMVQPAPTATHPFVALSAKRPLLDPKTSVVTEKAYMTVCVIIVLWRDVATTIREDIHVKTRSCVIRTPSTNRQAKRQNQEGKKLSVTIQVKAT